MNHIKIKRIYEPPEDTDGKRILVDRLWPRGMSKERAALDSWAKAIAPSSDLRKWFGHTPEKLNDFGKAYRGELSQNPDAAAWASKIADWLKQGDVTLLYAARDPQVNHALILKDWLEQKILKIEI
jgi:uncharacterized protein YeaO (DUF488 family)